MTKENLIFLILLFALIGVITTLFLFVKLTIFLINLLRNAFPPTIQPPTEKDFEEYRIKRHQKMKENLEKAEKYRKDKWQDPYNP